MYMNEKKKTDQAVSPATLAPAMFAPATLAPEGGAGETSPGAGCACGGTAAGVSLAMVYSPRQYWRDAYSPAEALDRGTLFAELDKPLTGVSGGGDAT